MSYVLKGGFVSGCGGFIYWPGFVFLFCSPVVHWWRMVSYGQIDLIRWVGAGSVDVYGGLEWFWGWSVLQ